MELDGTDVLFCVATQHNRKDPSAECLCHRIMVCFLVSCFCDWICKPDSELLRRGQCTELKQCHTNQNSVPMRDDAEGRKRRKEIWLNQRGLSGKSGYKSSVQGLAICLETHKGKKVFQGLGVFTGAACHYGYGFKFKHRAPNGAASLNSADKRTGRTGLNLHFILVILFSTNKLTPEKT